MSLPSEPTAMAFPHLSSKSSMPGIAKDPGGRMGQEQVKTLAIVKSGHETLLRVAFQYLTSAHLSISGP